MTYWLNGEFEQQSPIIEPKVAKLPSTPLPSLRKNQMANNGRALNNVDYQEDHLDESAVPLLSITSPPEYNLNA